MNYRKLEEYVFKLLMGSSLIFILVLFLVMIFVVTIRGIEAININMLTDTPRGGYYLGKEGGIANAIVGSLCLAFGSTIMCILLSLPVAFALQKEYSGKYISSFTRLILDILWGIPSIVYGAFGFIIMTYMGIRTSLLGGIFVLTILILPIMTRSIDEVIKLVPVELKEASIAMGATRFETTVFIIAKQIFPGIITGIMLAFGRAIGDAASILFTTGYSDYIPRSVFDSAGSLPLAIFFQLSTPYPEVQQRAYASALVLLFIVSSVSITARLLSKRASRNIIRTKEI